MHVRPVSTEFSVTQTRTLPPAENAAQLLPVVLRVLPQAPLSERKQDGEVLGFSQQEPRAQAARQGSIEQGRNGAARLRELARRGAWRQLETLLTQVGEASLPQENREEWEQWIEEWRQTAQGRESARLFLFGTLFSRILAPVLSMQTQPEGRIRWEQFIKKLSSILQQLLPPGRAAQDFLRICEQAWTQYLKDLESTARQNASLGQILDQINILPLSTERQRQLDQWVEGLVSIPSDNTEMQLLHCAVLIVRYLRPLLREVREQALKVLLAKIEEDVCRWIEPRLPQGESIEAILQQAREGLIEEAVTRVHLQLLDQVTTESLNQLEGRANRVQQERQAGHNQLTQALGSVQQQRHSIVSTTTQIDEAATSLEQTQVTLHAELSTLVTIAEQEESAQARLVSQVSQLQQEASRIGGLL